jgi:hypothetical protein
VRKLKPGLESVSKGKKERRGKEKDIGRRKERGRKMEREVMRERESGNTGLENESKEKEKGERGRK